jgi:hypothetical protein
MKKIKVQLDTEKLKRKLDLRNGLDGINGVRGSKFLGSVLDIKDLPKIDGDKIKEGDYVLVVNTGEIWYA